MTKEASRRDELADAVLRVAMTQGLENASIREVAAEAGVAIGTVQHHFHSKDEMLVFAFRRVVERTTARALAVDKSAGLRRALVGILAEMLPLDEARRSEAAVNFAFATRAAHNPRLAEVQAETLRYVWSDFAALLGAARVESGKPPGRRLHQDAVELFALVDGLALHTIAAPGLLTPEALLAAVQAFLDRVLDAD